MPGIDPDDIGRVLHLCRDPVVVARLLRLKIGPRRPTQGGVFVSCPWHDERSPSCALRTKGGALLAYCHGCHRSGNVFGFAGAVWRLDRKTDFPEVVTRLADLVGVALSPAQGGPRTRPPRWVPPVAPPPSDRERLVAVLDRLSALLATLGPRARAAGGLLSGEDVGALGAVIAGAPEADQGWLVDSVLGVCEGPPGMTGVIRALEEIDRGECDLSGIATRRREVVGDEGAARQG